MRDRQRDGLPVKTVGWREWVALPDFQIPVIKTKVDTGARSSSLHAFDVQPFSDRGTTWVRFKIHPFQRSDRSEMSVTAELLEYRRIKSSGGHETRRPVVQTRVSLLGQIWTIELTLASRDAMGFRMLLGREAMRQRFLVNPSRSFLAGIPPQVPQRKRRST